MRISIVGAGVLGSIFGILFKEKGFDVTLIEVLEERVRLIDREGLWMTRPDGERVHADVAITADPASVGPTDVVMVCVKGYHTRSAIESAMPMIGPDTVVLSVQNGLGNLETIAEKVGSERVVGGITAHSGMPVSLNEVRYVGGLGPLLVIGPFDGVSHPGFVKVFEALKNTGLDVHTAPDINAVIWKKLIANVSTNVVAALTGLTGGQAVLHAPTVKVIEGLALELAAVAKAKGIVLPEFDDPLAFALKAFESTKDNRVSMLQDVEAGRPTEIGNLNEVIVSEGKRLGIPTPVNETVSLLVRGVEEKNSQNLARREKSTHTEAVRQAIQSLDLATLKTSLEASPLAASLAIRYTRFEPGHAEAEMAPGAALPNFLGYTHTGALYALAEQVMAAAANTLGHAAYPLNLDLQFLKACDPTKPVAAQARVIDTQGRIARVQVELSQGSDTVAKLTEMLYLRT